MAYEGRQAETEDTHARERPAGPRGPSRGFWLGMGGVVAFAMLLAATGLIAGAGRSQTAPVPTEPPLPAEVTSAPRETTPPDDITDGAPGDVRGRYFVASGDEPPATAASLPALTGDGSGQSSSVASSPVAVASSWSTAPAFAPPAPAPALTPAAEALAKQASAGSGIEIVLQGQDWGVGEVAQVTNIGAVVSAIQALPVSVSSSVASGPNGRLQVLSNRQGRTLDGWQPYGDSPRSFYTNSDQGPSGYRPAHEIVLATGSNQTTVAHEMLHAYQFRGIGADEYVLALLGDEMRAFMAAGGWRQRASDEEVRQAVHQSWNVVNAMFVYEGPPLAYVDSAGTPAVLDAPNPLEAYAMTGALYYTRAGDAALPDWPELWAWFDAHAG